MKVRVPAREFELEWHDIHRFYRWSRPIVLFAVVFALGWAWAWASLHGEYVALTREQMALARGQLSVIERQDAQLVAYRDHIEEILTALGTHGEPADGRDPKNRRNIPSSIQEEGS